MGFDREAFFRSWIDTLFLKASWIDSVKQLTGINAVSQVWGERPEWYLWIAGAAGPYNLSLHHTSAIVSDGGILQQGLFAIKCYPYRDTPLFSSFSEAERQLIQSGRFDHTNTPCFEAQTQIPETFFSIGTLTITANVEGSFAALTFEAMDAFRLFQGCDSTHERPADGLTPKMLRNVPGWEIGYPLFDRINALHAFSARCAPCYYRLTRTRGFEHLVSPEQKIEVRPSPTCRLISASVLFSAETDSDKRLIAEWITDLEAGDEILVEKKFQIGSESSGECQDIGVNMLWWRLANAEFKCCLNSTCGCSH
jgi:hypothetical protein